MGKLKRKGIRPGYVLHLGPITEERYVRRLPFRRAWWLIGILLISDLILLIPAISTFRQAAAEWARFEDLFDLVMALFLSAWLLGWSTAPLLITTLLAILLFGRETLRVTPGTLELFMGLPGLGLKARYELSAVRNLRLETPPKKSGKSWRGPHGAFDYGANSGAFGSGLNEADLAAMRSNIETAGRQAIHARAATPGELEGDWPQPAASALAETVRAVEPAAPPKPLTLASPSAIALILANGVPIVGAVLWGWDLGTVLVLYWAESAVVGFYNLCKIAVIAKWFALFAGVFIISHGLSFYLNFMGRSEYRGRTVRTQMTEPYSRIIFMHLVLILGGGAALVLGDTLPVLMVIIAAKVVVDLRAHFRERRAA